MTDEIAKALYNELSMFGRVQVTDELAFVAARWQKNRIIQELKVFLAHHQKNLDELNRNPRPQLATTTTYIKGITEGKIETLKSLIAILE